MVLRDQVVHKTRRKQKFGGRTTSQLHSRTIRKHQLRVYMTIVKWSLCRKAVEPISALSQVCHNHLLRTSIYFSEASSNQVRVTIVWP